MRYTASVDTALSTTRLSLSETCYTDSLPLVREIFFHNAEFDVDSSAFALGAAVLTRSYCGETAEFGASGIGLEYARAIAALGGQVLSSSPVNGRDRTQALAEQDVLCAPARLVLGVAPSDGLPLVPIDWSGDLVAPATRSSEGFRQGRYFTNAGLIADETMVSIALGLMHGGSHCRKLIVPAPTEAGAAAFETVRAALAIVGIAVLPVASTEGRA